MAERERLGALAAYRILDTPPEADFDDLVALAAQLAGVPTALVSLVDANRQWFKARVGLDVASTARDISFCDQVVLSGTELEISDARRDPRFATNPLVVDAPHIVFYAGYPLTSRDGHVLGTLCVIGYEPGRLSDQQRQAMRVLARQVMTQLELRRLTAEQADEIEVRRRTEAALERSQLDLRLLADHASDIVTRHGIDGRVSYVSPSIRQVLGYQPEDVVGGLPADIMHPDDEVPLEAAFVAAAEGTPTSITVRAKHADGTERCLETRLNRIDFSDGHWEVRSAARDVTDRIAAERQLAELLVTVETAERRWRLTFDDAPVGIALVALDGSFQHVNPALCTMLGYPERELLARTFQDVTHPDDLEKDLDLVAELVIGNRDAYVIEKRYLRADGETVWGRLSAGLVSDPDTLEPLHFVGQVQDITREREAVARQDALVSSMLAIADLELSSQVVLPEICRHAQRLTHAEGASIEVLDETKLTVVAASGVLEEVLGVSFAVEGSLSGLTVAENRAVICTDIDADGRALPALTGLGMRSVIVTPLRRAGRVLGTIKVAASGVESFSDADREALEVLAAPLGAVIDNTWRFEERSQQARSDALTGLANRAHAMQVLGRVLNRQARFGGCTTLVFIDLDGFKAVNDQLGHAAGDELLRHFAARLRAAVRSSDLPARLGGDEFLVICESVPDVPTAQQVAVRFTELLAAVGRDSGHPQVKASIGVAVAVDAADAEVLLATADAAMYEAKTAVDGPGYVLRVCAAE